jgi:hypothetical protein
MYAIARASNAVSHATVHTRGKTLLLLGSVAA